MTATGRDDSREALVARIASNEDWLSKNWHLGKEPRQTCERNIVADKARLAALDTPSSASTKTSTTRVSWSHVVGGDHPTQNDWFALLYSAANSLLHYGRFEGQGATLVAIQPSKKNLRALATPWAKLGRVVAAYAQYDRDRVDKKPDWRSVVRDAFLEGRDDDAIDILLTEAVAVRMPAAIMAKLQLSYYKEDGKRIIQYAERP